MTRRSRSDVAKTDPADRPLTGRERRLVEIVVAAASEGRDLSRTELGEAAGYGTGESARVQTYRALARPRVRAALISALRETAQADAVGAYGVLRHVARSAKSARDRVIAARSVLEIAGVVGGGVQPSGPAVAVQIVFKTDAADLLRQPPQVAGAVPQPIAPLDPVVPRSDPWVDEKAREAAENVERVRAGELVTVPDVQGERPTRRPRSL